MMGGCIDQENAAAKEKVAVSQAAIFGFVRHLDFICNDSLHAAEARSSSGGGGT
jgi:hypothetical protein